jgi:hypothetical protein
VVNAAPVEPTPPLDPKVIPGGEISKPAPTYHEASSGEGNPWVRRSADPLDSDSPTNEGRQLMVQFSSDLINKDLPKDTGGEYYDKLYSGVRPGYARPRDFWEIPQWMGFAAHNLPNADVYVVRDMAQAKEFLNNAKYDRVLVSALDVNAPLVKEIAASYKGQMDVGGYVKPGTFLEHSNITHHPSLENMMNHPYYKEQGLEHQPGVDYRHFQGSDVIPRLTLSDGCLHKCAFCVIADTKVQTTPEEVVNQQADAIAKLGSKLVYVNDKTFGQAPNYKQLSDLYEKMKATNPDFNGFIVQTTAAQMGKIPVEWLKKSGIKYVELGIESYNDPILKEMHKPATEKLIDAATQKLRENGIALIPNILVGLPGETAQTYTNTLNFLKRNSDVISHANIYNLAVYGDSELAKKLTTASEGDFNENVLEKTFHSDPEIHRQFSGDLYGLAQNMLDKEPLSADESSKTAKANGVESIANLDANNMVSKKGMLSELADALNNPEGNYQIAKTRPERVAEIRSRMKANNQAGRNSYAGLTTEEKNIVGFANQNDMTKVRGAISQGGGQFAGGPLADGRWNIYDPKSGQYITVEHDITSDIVEKAIASVKSGQQMQKPDGSWETISKKSPELESKNWAARAAESAKEGGFTIHPVTGESPTEGHVIEVSPEDRKVLPANATQKDIEQFHAERKPLFDAHPELHVGGYENELNVAAVGTPEGAKLVGNKLDQKAGWDAKKQEIVEYSGKGTQTSFPDYPLEQRLKDLQTKPEPEGGALATSETGLAEFGKNLPPWAEAAVKAIRGTEQGIHGKISLGNGPLPPKADIQKIGKFIYDYFQRKLPADYEGNVAVDDWARPMLHLFPDEDVTSLSPILEKIEGPARFGKKPIDVRGETPALIAKERAKLAEQWTPAMVAAVKEASATREEGLSKTLLHSAAKVQDVIRKVKEAQNAKSQDGDATATRGDIHKVGGTTQPGGESKTAETGAGGRDENVLPTKANYRGVDNEGEPANDASFNYGANAPEEHEPAEQAELPLSAPAAFKIIGGTQEEFEQAVKNTPFASINKDGSLTVNLTRFQRPEAAGGTSARGGVYHLAGEGGRGVYSANEEYGGDDEMRGRTTFKNPAIVRTRGEAFGGPMQRDFMKSVVDDDAAVNIHALDNFAPGIGHDPIAELHSSALDAISVNKTKDGVDSHNLPDIISQWLDENGGDPKAGYDIWANSKTKHQLASAMWDNVVGQTAKNMGHDAIIGVYAKRGAGLQLSEVFDLTADQFPKSSPPAGSTTLLMKHPLNLEPTGKTGQGTILDLAKALGKWAQQGLQPNKEIYIAMQRARAELDDQMARDDSMMDWYKKDTKDAVDTLKKNGFPELENPTQEKLFRTLWGITSYGVDPDVNLTSAGTAWKEYQKTGTIPLANEAANKNWPGYSGIKGSITILNKLINEKGEQGTMDWLLSEHPVSELREQKVKTHALGGVPGQAADTKYGAMIFGPKAGPFVLGLHGIANEAVVDIWGARIWRRLSGTLTPENVNDPVTTEESRNFNNVVTTIAKEKGLDISDVQAQYWGYEHDLYAAHGVGEAAKSYKTAADKYVQRQKEGNTNAYLAEQSDLFAAGHGKAVEETEGGRKSPAAQLPAGRSEKGQSGKQKVSAQELMRALSPLAKPAK